MKKLNKILTNHLGSANMEQMVIIVIAFVAGALLIAAIWSALNGGFSDGMNTQINDFLN